MNAKLRPAVVRGFTLVEVMMAAGVMALALVGMVQVLISGSEMLDTSRKQTIAMQIIHGQIDNVRLNSWSTINNYPASLTVDVDAPDQSPNLAQGLVFGSNLPAISKGFQLTRTVTSVRTDLKQITFTVRWTGNTGRPYQRSGSTYYGNNGLYVTYQRS